MLIFNKINDPLTRITSINLIYTFILKGLSFIITLIYVPVLLDCLDEKIYGVWLALTSIVSWLSLFDIGIGNGLKNKLTEALTIKDHDYSKCLVSTAYFYSIKIFLLVCIVAVIINFFIHWDEVLNVDRIYRTDLTITVFLVILSFCIRFVLQIITPVLTATQNVRINAIIEVVSQILVLLSVLALTYFNIKSLITFSIVVLFIPVILLYIFSIRLYTTKLNYLKPSLKFSDKKYFSDIFSLGVKFFIIQIAAIVIFQTNSFLIANSFGPEDVTKYNIVFKYFNVLIFLWGILMTPLWPSFTETFILGDYAWIKKVIKYCIYAYVLTVVIALFMTYYGENIIIIWLHKDLNIQTSFFYLMFIFSLISIWNNIWGSIIGALGKIRISMYSTTLSAILFFPFFYCLKNNGYGVKGAIISMIICISLSAIISPIQVYYFVYIKKNNPIVTKILS